MTSQQASAHRETILVVEDDPSVRNLISTALDSVGYHHIAASTGRAAIAAATNAPDTILLDLGLPDMDGIEVVRKVRTWSSVPIIVVSARADSADKVKALDEGADDYLTKPFSVDELLARVRVALRRWAGMVATEDAVFVNGALEIDFAAGLVRRDGEELHLTPIEYKLCCLLARNVDKVLTHEYILSEIWGSHTDRDLASLRVFMGTLRKKLEPDPSHPIYLHTHVGVGYRMSRV